MHISKRLAIAIAATVIIAVVTVAVVYYSNTISKPQTTHIHGTYSHIYGSLSPTIMIIPIAEHTPFDIYHLALYYCIVDRFHNPYKTLMTLFENYKLRGNIVYYPNISYIASKIFNINFTKSCLNTTNITIKYVLFKSADLYATQLNCSDKFYRRCLSIHKSGKYCVARCYAFIRSSIVNNTYVYKSLSSVSIWITLNSIISSKLRFSLGTPEIVYLYLPRENKTARILIYLGLQIPSNVSSYELYYLIREAVTSALEHNHVPSRFTRYVKETFLTCLRAVKEGDISVIKECLALPGTVFKREGNFLYAYSGTYITGMYGTINRSIASELLRIAKDYGFTVVKGKDNLYVVMFVSPTCPYCKTELLSLIETGILPKPQ